MWMRFRHPRQVHTDLKGDIFVMKFIKSTVRNVQTAGELMHFFGRHKRWWLFPILITLFLLGALIVVAQSSSLAPFIYTMF
jgi:hypothetical protein